MTHASLAYKVKNIAGVSALALVACIALQPACALAQAAPAASPRENSTSSDSTASSDSTESSIAEIVVTAGKREQRLLDVGMSVSAFSAETLKDQGVHNLSDLANVVPGLSFTNVAGGNLVPTLRGVGFSERSLNATPDVTIYNDQFPLFVTSLAKGANLDLERVEVLKGPQGTLFGQNATGGAINYIAAKPTSNLQAGGDLTYARFDRIDINAYVSGPLTDTLGARLAVHTEQGGAWQKSYLGTTNRKLGDRNFISARLLFDWNPTDRFNTTLMFATWQDHSDGQAAQDYRNLSALPTAHAEIVNFPLAPNKARVAEWDPLRAPKSNEKFYQANMRTEYDLSDEITFTNLIQYVDQKIDNQLGEDGTNLGANTSRQTGHITSFYEEIRLSNGGDGPLRWILGGNYGRDTVDELTTVFNKNSNAVIFFSSFANTVLGNAQCGLGAIPIAPLAAGEAFSYPAPCVNFPGNLKNTSEVLTNTYAVFGNVEYDLVKELTLRAGIRYTRTSTSNISCVLGDGEPQTGAAFTAIYTAFGVITPGSVVPFDQCLTLNTTNPTSPWSPYRAKFKEHNLPWQVGLDWKPVDGVLVYGNVSKGYKAGGFPAVAGASSSDQLTPYVQESLLSYEAGTKARVGRALILQGAVFHYDYANKQIHSVIPDPLFGVLTRIRNVPKSKVTGAELQVNWQSSFGLSVDASGTYLDSKITRFDGFSRTGAPVNFAGSNLPYTSQWSGSLDISHQQNIANNKIGFVGARGSYRSSAFNAFGPEGPENDKISAYTLLDLRIGVKAADGGWQFSLWGKNVTNKFYITSEGPASDTTYARYVGMPATYGATLSFKLR